MAAPEAADAFLDAGLAPVALAARAGSGTAPRPARREALGVRFGVVGVDLAFHQPALVEEKAAEFGQGVLAVVAPAGLEPLGEDVVHRNLEVLLRVELGGGLVVEAEDVPGHGDVVGAGDQRAGTPAEQPGRCSVPAGRCFRAARCGCKRAGAGRAARGNRGSI